MPPKATSETARTIDCPRWQRPFGAGRALSGRLLWPALLCGRLLAGRVLAFIVLRLRQGELALGARWVACTKKRSSSGDNVSSSETVRGRIPRAKRTRTHALKRHSHGEAAASDLGGVVHGSGERRGRADRAPFPLNHFCRTLLRLAHSSRSASASKFGYEGVIMRPAGAKFGAIRNCRSRAAPAASRRHAFCGSEAAGESPKKSRS